MYGDFRGVQVASSLNIAGGSFRGLQFGMVNMTRYFDKGLQLGLINITEEHHGVPIGLVTYVRHVPFRYRVYIDDMRMVNFALRSGNEDFYNDLLISRRLEGDVRYHSLGVGFGRKQYLGEDWSFDYGISASKVLDDDFEDGKWRTGKLGGIAKLSFIFRYDLGYEASFFIGPVINAWVSEVETEELSSSDLWVDEVKKDKYFRVWPGFVVGFEL